MLLVRQRQVNKVSCNSFRQVSTLRAPHFGESFTLIMVLLEGEDVKNDPIEIGKRVAPFSVFDVSHITRRIRVVLDVGFGNLSERQPQRLVESINEQSFDVPLERLRIVPGKSTPTIERIISPQEFFQRAAAGENLAYCLDKPA